MSTKKMQFKFPGRATWEKLLGRWSEFPSSPEKNLICAVIAQAITDHNERGRDFRLVADGSGFWGLMLDKYCRLIALDSQFVREQILTAARRDGETVAVPV